MTVERIAITDRSQWLALRSFDLTASDIGAAVGIDPYKTPLALYAEKTGMLMAAPDSNIMRRGRWMEAAVLEALREEQPGWMVERCKVYLRDPALRLGATPDAVATTDDGEIVNVQCKVVSKPTFERDWVDGPPMHYVLQTLTEGLLQGTGSYIAALVVDTYSADLKLFPVPRHGGAEARVMQIADEFWKNVENGVRPAADFKRDAETVAQLWPQSVPDPVLDLTGDNYLPDLLVERGVIKQAIKDCEKRVGEIDTEIKAKLGEHEQASLPGWRVIWKTVNRPEFTTPASSYRALRVVDQRDKEATA